MGLLPAYRVPPLGMWLPKPTVFDFMDGALPDGATFTRASTAWYFDSSGVLQSAGTDVPCWTHDPATGALLGVQVEPASTNCIRNASGGGAANGSPGTAPSNWSVTASNNGVTRTVSNSGGVENGIPCLDFRFAGTPTATNSKLWSFEQPGQIAAAPGQLWAASVFWRIVAGTMSNVSVRLGIRGLTAGGTSAGLYGGQFVPTGAALSAQRASVVHTLDDSAAVFVRADTFLDFTIGLPMDITLRIGLLQLELQPASTSPIITTSAAVARAADVLSLPLDDGRYMVALRRVAGTSLIRATASGGSITVPTSASPLQRVTAWRI